MRSRLILRIWKFSREIRGRWVLLKESRIFQIFLLFLAIFLSARVIQLLVELKRFLDSF